jgi:thioredoxin-like negative regulator of GroEL
VADSPDFRSRYADALAKGFGGDVEGSIRDLEALAKEEPNHLDLVYDLAMLQLTVGNYEDACRNLKYILERDPTHAKAIQQATYC